MKTKITFTKRDVMVCVGCVLFLLANLGAVGSIGRRRAKAAMCLANLSKWGRVFEMYTNDNEGYFPRGWFMGPGPVKPQDYWMECMREYYKEPDLRLCPLATVPGSEIGIGEYGSGGYTAWGIFTGAWNYVVPGDYGSYGWNSYICYVPDPYGNYFTENNWENINVSGGDNIPMFMDHKWLDCWPHHSDEPPEFDGQYWSQGSQMGRIVQNRHGGGFINVTFLDGSARKVGLKGLWRLKWHRTFDLDYPLPVWPDWMEGFEDY